jgi:hypothetical protein
MRVHIGKKIREEVTRRGMPVSEFARRINRSRNVVYDIFERESVDTALLNRIGKVLHCDFFSLYSAQKEYAQEGVRSFATAEPQAKYAQAEHSDLQNQVRLLKHEITYLKKIVSLLEKEAGRAKPTIKKTK